MLRSACVYEMILVMLGTGRLWRAATTSSRIVHHSFASLCLLRRGMAGIAYPDVASEMREAVSKSHGHEAKVTNLYVFRRLSTVVLRSLITTTAICSSTDRPVGRAAMPRFGTKSYASYSSRPSRAAQMYPVRRKWPYPRTHARCSP